MKLLKISNSKKDKNNQLVAESIRSLPQQMTQVVSDWKGVRKFQGNFKQVIVCGMGGSTLSADIIRYALGDQLLLPIRIVNDYHLPSFADREALIIVSSYSGNTEEALSCYKEARRKKLNLFVITTGGALAQRAQRDQVFSYIFQPKYNPSHQPRLGLGYGIASLLMLLADIKACSLTGKKIIALAKTIRQEASAQEVKLVQKRSAIIIASEHLIGVAHALSNQMNETAKTFAPYFALPELNHHLLEGLASISNPKKDWVALFLSSDRYISQVKKRYTLTEHIFTQQKILTYDKSFKGDSLTQALRCLYWSASLTYKVALAQGRDTTAIPWVDYFKEQLR